MRNVVITGGSRGIGAAAVERFSQLGDRVTFFYRQDHAAAQAVAKRTGATAVCCDVADGAAVRAAFSKISETDVLILAAGISRMGLMSQLSEEDWDTLFHVNVKGVYHCVNAAMPAFLQKHSGCIITVSSMWGQVGASCEVAYSATKGAVIAMTKALAKELGPSGIRVNCISPGLIQTDMCAELEEETLTAFREDTPVGRLGCPEDVANAMEYLAQADFVTGHILSVNGGYVI